MLPKPCGHFDEFVKRFNLDLKTFDEHKKGGLVSCIRLNQMMIMLPKSVGDSSKMLDQLHTSAENDVSCPCDRNNRGFGPRVSCREPNPRRPFLVRKWDVCPYERNKIGDLRL